MSFPRSALSSSLSAFGLCASGFGLVALSESEAHPGFEAGATRVHVDGEPCECYAECIEDAEAWLLERDLVERRLPNVCWEQEASGRI